VGLKSGGGEKGEAWGPLINIKRLRVFGRRCDEGLGERGGGISTRWEEGKGPLGGWVANR